MTELTHSATNALGSRNYIVIFTKNAKNFLREALIRFR